MDTDGIKEWLASVWPLINGFDDLVPEELFLVKFTALVISMLKPVRMCVLVGAVELEFRSALRVEVEDQIVAVSTKEFGI